MYLWILSNILIQYLFTFNAWLAYVPFREIEDKNLLMKCTVPVKKTSVLGWNSIQYKYAILRDYNSEPEYEFIPNKSSSGPSNRFLSIDIKRLSAGITGNGLTLCAMQTDCSQKLLFYSSTCIML